MLMGEDSVWEGVGAGGACLYGGLVDLPRIVSPRARGSVLDKSREGSNILLGVQYLVGYEIQYQVVYSTPSTRSIYSITPLLTSSAYPLCCPIKDIRYSVWCCVVIWS